MLLKVTGIIIFMPYVVTAFYNLPVPFLSLVYVKHLSLNMKQTRSECVRTFQIGQNRSRLLSRKINTPRFGLPPSGGLDSTQEPGRNYCGKRGLRREKQSTLTHS